MQAIIQSAFLQALAQSLIASIWQMALVWLACLATMKLFKLSSSQKFNIAFIAQLSGLGLFFYTCFSSYNHPQVQLAAPVFTNNILSTINAALFAYMPYLAIIYLIALVVKLNRFGFIYAASKKLKHNQLIKISVECRLFVQQMTETLSIHKKVKIYLSEKINCPLTIGFLKPVILIPLAAVNHLTTQQMEAVILHELAHIKRADYLLYILQSIADKIFFFNIFSIMLSHIIERERENACDDWVMQFRYNSMHYAEALFKLGRLKALPVLAMPLSGKKENLLLARVKRLLHNQPNKNSYSIRSVGLSFSSVAIVGFLCLLSYFKPAESTIPGNNNITNNTFTTAGPAENNSSTVAAKPVAAVYTIPTPVLVKHPGKTIEKKEENNIKQENVVAAITENKLEQLYAARQRLNDESERYLARQNYLVQVQQKIDSLQTRLPQMEQAVNAQVVVTPEIMQKAMSYKNFKQIENMLAASGDSIKIIEAEASKNSYQKQVTIESTDKNGNKHIYTVVIQLYQ